MTVECPFASFNFPDAGHSAKQKVHELELREAAIGDLTLSANKSHSRIFGVRQLSVVLPPLEFRHVHHQLGRIRR
jgi:hypothetical protein